MRCEACGKQNAEGVKFCVYCGSRLVAAAGTKPPPPPLPSSLPAPSPRVTSETAFSGGLPAYRPRGIVLTTVLGVLFGFAWLVLAAGFTAAAQTGLLLDRRALGVLCSVLGQVFFLAFAWELTAAIGLWLMTKWGRVWTVYMRVFGLVAAVAILVCGLVRPYNMNEAIAGQLLVASLIDIALSIGILLYLAQPEIDSWFRES